MTREEMDVEEIMGSGEERTKCTLVHLLFNVPLNKDMCSSLDVSFYLHEAIYKNR